MGKGKQKFGKNKRNFKTSVNKKKTNAKYQEKTNKKALFNRYKDKQKVEEELIKKKHLEERFQKQNVVYSESESEEDEYEKLLASFNIPSKSNKAIESDDEETDNELEHEAVHSDNVIKNNHLSTKYTDSENEDENDDASTSDDDLMIRNDKEEGSDDETTNDDPFIKHLQYDLSDELLVSLSNDPPHENDIAKSWPVLGNLSIKIPRPIETIKSTKPKVYLVEEQVYAPVAKVPQIISQVDFKNLHIKSQIQGNIVLANKTNLIKRDLELNNIFTPLQKELFSIINNYQDLYFPERTFTNADEIRYTYCLHIVNHMLKTRTKIIHHNAKLAKKTDGTEDYRDQGLVRPKVLIIVPFKDAAYRVVKTLIDLVVPKEAGQVINRKRFDDDFTGGELIMPTKNPKPEDYELMFSGNTDDTFRLGLTVTKKTLKLYTDFYSSDILIASPLGLRMIIGAEGEEERDFDFLASIELLIMDQTDVFLMQNWEHLLHVLDHLHLQPKKSHGTDFSRIRSWAANGWSKYYRQTLLFCSVALPELKSVMNRKCQNYAGKVIVANSPEIGSVQDVEVQVPQLFYRFTASDVVASIDARFEYFIKEVLPKQRDSILSHTLLYVPSYFDFVRIRNYLKREDINFVQICEYSKDAKIARARDMFFHTETHFLLYSERVHFFRRFRIKGIRHIIFYQPPVYPHFYSEMCNLMQRSNQNKYGGSDINMSISMMYCKYDVHRAAAILGVPRLTEMMRSDKTVHMYVTKG